MRRRISLASLLLPATLLAACSDAPTDVLSPQAVSTISVAPGVVIPTRPEPARHLVLFNGTAPADFADRVISLGGEVAFQHGIGVAVVSGLDDQGAAALEAAVKAGVVVPAPTFRLAEPAGAGGPVPAETLYPTAGPTAASLAEPENAGPANAAPSLAALYWLQWNMEQVRASGAWSAGRLGSPAVAVAILDTGIDYLIPDMVGRVDLSRSISFVPDDDAAVAAHFPDRHPSTDLHFHGTNVATQVASNAALFAGVTAGTTLLSVKVCGRDGSCPGVVQGLLHAIDAGADVINLSMGGGLDRAGAPGVVSFFNRLVGYAHQRGVTMVVAAGNEATDLDRNRAAILNEAGEVIDWAHAPSLFSFYCDAPHVICVGATDADDRPAGYTNFGRSSIDVAAPGGDVRAGDLVYSQCPTTSLFFPVCGTGTFLVWSVGTSQAAPHVAGLAALAVEDVGRSPERVKAYIKRSADPLEGVDPAFYGKGRINVGRAIGAF